MESFLTLAADSLPPNIYINQAGLLHYGDSPASLEPGRHILAEIEACEVLRRHPHPNVALYLGCTTENGRVKGLCLDRFPMTLLQKMSEGAIFDKALCLQGTEDGVRHMHSLGLVHNDLNLSKIIIDGEKAVVIDFDSCEKDGEKLGLKWGTVGWEIEGAVTQCQRMSTSVSRKYEIF